MRGGYRIKEEEIGGGGGGGGGGTIRKRKLKLKMQREEGIEAIMQKGKGRCI